MSAPTGANIPHIPFHPGPSTAQEIGVMLAFMAAFVLSMVVYLLFWKLGNRRSERKELARRAALIQQGESVLGERGVELEVMGERFENDTLRRWTWGGVQAF